MPVRAPMALTGYVATIPVSNWLVAHYGAVPVGFGLTAPAGVFTVGVALVLRDLVHDWLGHRVALAAILAGAVVSYLLASPHLATASAAAFGLAELVDMTVYAPLRERSLEWAMLASNAVGLVVDSALFLWLAFGSFVHLPGQVLAKAEMTLLAVGVIAALRRQHEAVTQ